MTVKQGVRFSENYITRGELGSDSERFRMRLYRLFTAFKLDDGPITAEHMELMLGVELPWTGYGTSWKEFFLNCELRDLLDSITIIARKLIPAQPETSMAWRKGVASLLNQEHLRYALDPEGGVHFAVDDEFERNNSAAIRSLSADRFTAARAHFEAAQRALDANPQQTREAIRQTFECVETIFKLMFPGSSQLSSTESVKRLRPLIDRLYTGSENKALSQWLEGLARWINGAHQYRHGQGVEAPDNPSLATTVLTVSSGAAYARWLAELDSIALPDGKG